MSKALPGEHYCKNHQGNHSHYAPHNCTVCTQATEIERLRAELAEWKQEWQTMETAPKDGSRILLATPSGKIADGFWSLEYRVWSWPYVMVEPTHWTRSLPIPGRKGEGEE